MVSEKIKQLREKNGLKQTDLARMLNITRSSVNAWEMGISIPSTQFVYDLAKVFRVSTDYILGIDESATISVKGLDSQEVAILVELANKFRENRCLRKNIHLPKE